MNAALRSCVATLLARQCNVYSVRYVSAAVALLSAAAQAAVSTVLILMPWGRARGPLNPCCHAACAWHRRCLQGYKGLVDGGKNINRMKWADINDIMQIVCRPAGPAVPRNITHTL